MKEDDEALSARLHRVCDLLVFADDLVAALVAFDKAADQAGGADFDPCLKAAEAYIAARART